MPHLSYYGHTDKADFPDKGVANNVKSVSPSNNIGSHESLPNCKSVHPELSELDASFPKLSASSGNRRYFRKAIRSPCSQQGSSRSVYDSSTNEGSSNSGNSNNDVSSNQRGASNDPNNGGSNNDGNSSDNVGNSSSNDENSSNNNGNSSGNVASSSNNDGNSSNNDGNSSRNDGNSPSNVGNSNNGDSSSNNGGNSSNSDGNSNNDGNSLNNNSDSVSSGRDPNESSSSSNSLNPEDSEPSSSAVRQSRNLNVSVSSGSPVTSSKDNLMKPHLENGPERVQQIPVVSEITKNSLSSGSSFKSFDLSNHQLRSEGISTNTLSASSEPSSVSFLKPSNGFMSTVSDIRNSNDLHVGSFVPVSNSKSDHPRIERISTNTLSASQPSSVTSLNPSSALVPSTSDIRNPTDLRVVDPVSNLKSNHLRTEDIATNILSASQQSSVNLLDPSSGLAPSVSDIRKPEDLQAGYVVSVSNSKSNRISWPLNPSSILKESVQQLQNPVAPEIPKLASSSLDVANSSSLTHNQSGWQVVPSNASVSHSSPLIPLLSLPDKTVYAVPGIDTPEHPVVNSKRAVQRLRPSLRKKMLKQTSDSSVHPEISEGSSNLAHPAPSESHPVSVSDQGTREVNSSSSKGPSDENLNANLPVPRPIKTLRKKPIQKSGPASSDPTQSSDKNVSADGKGDAPADSSTNLSDGPNTSVASTSAKDKKEPTGPVLKKPTSAQEHIPCTCGVFLSGQFTKGAHSEPNGNPVVEHQLGQTFPCTPAGKSQCQNKCLDMMVKHLPNSGAIICGSIDRDIYKEKAYLWVKNCNDVWVNSNLSSGKEHCCQDSQPIKCSLMTPPK